MNEKLKRFEQHLLEQLRRCNKVHFKSEETTDFYTGAISVTVDTLNKFYELFAEEVK